MWSENPSYLVDNKANSWTVLVPITFFCSFKDPLDHGEVEHRIAFINILRSLDKNPVIAVFQFQPNILGSERE